MCQFIFVLVLEFGPILAWYRFPAAEEFVVVFGVILCSLQVNRFSVLIAAVCGFALSYWNTQGLLWNRRHLEGSICCSKTFIYLSAFIVSSKTCKLPIPYGIPYALAPPYNQRCWLLNLTLMTHWKFFLLFQPFLPHANFFYTCSRHQI